jgi:RNA polymerase sigma factor (TIGR02999 family)
MWIKPVETKNEPLRSLQNSPQQHPLPLVGKSRSVDRKQRARRPAPSGVASGQASRTLALVSELTLILQRIDGGDASAAEQILPLVYDELRKLAAAKMARESAGQTLQPTALVHEAWLRLGGEAQPDWKNRAHFFAAAAEAMRRILIENARRRRAQRHGGAVEKVSASETGFDIAAPGADDELLLLHEALDGLAAYDARKAELVKHWYFAGLTLEEIAEVLGVSPRTADRDLAFAKAWLGKEIKRLRG